MHSFNQFVVKIARNMKETSTLHPEVELLFVAEGSAKVTIQNVAYELFTEDVILINSSVGHSIEADPNSIVCSIRYDYQVLVHILKKPNSFFICNSAADPTRKYVELKKLIWELIRLEVVERHKTDSSKYSVLYQILDELIEHFMADDTYDKISENYDADEKLQLIIHYVHQNYQDGISLSDLAKDMYTSTSTLSRLFKKQTGTYFAEYVNQVRIHYAINELLYTEKNMTKIAMDCGFSNASAFTKIFRETYNMAPTEYRQKMKLDFRRESDLDTSVLEELSKDLNLSGRFGQDPGRNNPLTVVSLNMNEAKSYQKNFTELVNGGFLHNLLQANVQYHLQYLAKELHFKYVRIWNVFDAKLQMSDGKTFGDYNFDAALDVFDFLIANHMHPWLEFTNRPDTIVREDGDNIRFESAKIEFESRRIWEDMFRSFVKTVVRRYGREEVEQWVFEVGREVFHSEFRQFYRDKDYSLTRVYIFVHRVIRECVPGARVGFSGNATNVKEKELFDTLSEIRTLGYYPDFVSCTLFPYQPSGSEKSSTESGSYSRSTDWDYERKELANFRALLDRAGLTNTKLYVTEWNLTVSTRNLLNDSCFRSSCFCRKIADTWQNADVIGIWMASDWICSAYDSRNVVHGGVGILTKDGIRKPIYFAVSFLAHLGRQVIQIGENHIATKMGPGEYQILVFNPSWYSSGYFLKAEKQMDPRELETIFDHCEAKTIQLELTGLSDDSYYFIKKRTVNQSQGSILDEWKKFGFDSRLERNDVKYLRDICVPGLSQERVKTRSGRLTVNAELQAQEISIYHIFSAE